VFAVVVEEVGARDLARAALAGARFVSFDESPELGDAAVARQRDRVAAHQLRSRPLRRVVRGGAGEPAVETARSNRVVEDLGGCHADVEHVGAGGCHAACVCLGELRRRGAHVAAERELELANRGPLEFRHNSSEGASDALGDGRVDLARVEPANVVSLEDRAVDCGAGHARGNLAARPVAFSAAPATAWAARARCGRRPSGEDFLSGRFQ